MDWKDRGVQRLGSGCSSWQLSAPRTQKRNVVLRGGRVIFPRLWWLFLYCCCLLKTAQITFSTSQLLLLERGGVFFSFSTDLWPFEICNISLHQFFFFCNMIKSTNFFPVVQLYGIASHWDLQPYHLDFQLQTCFTTAEKSFFWSYRKGIPFVLES